MMLKFRQNLKTLLFLLALAAFMFNWSPTHAQFGKLKDKLKNKVNNSKVQQKLNTQVNRASGGSAEDIEDQGITNAVHEKYVGKIVWSNEAISLNEPDESKFKNTFTTDEWIFGRLFLSQSMQKSIYEQTGENLPNLYYYYDVYVNGEKHKWELITDQLSGEKMKRTTQQVWVYIPDGSDRNGWMNLVNSLPEGKHEFKVDLRARNIADEIYGEPYATGSFTLIKKEGAVMKIGKSYSSYEAGMKNPELESKILSCIQGYAKSSDWKETFDKVKIASEEWYIIRNKYSGVILGRSVVAYCFAKWPKGHCTVQRFVFRQQYDGSKYNDNVSYDGLISNSQERIDCD